ncbi:MAG: polysaccharide biosynthesis protein, partial [Bacilli bacterium]
PLARKYGGIGSAIGTSLSLIIGNGIIINIYYHRYVGINVIRFWKEIFRMSIPNIIPIVIIILMMNIIELHGFTNLIVFGSIYSVLYFAVNYLFSVNEYEKKILVNILKKIKKIVTNLNKN